MTTLMPKFGPSVSFVLVTAVIVFAFGISAGAAADSYANDSIEYEEVKITENDLENDTLERQTGDSKIADSILKNSANSVMKHVVGAANTGIWIGYANRWWIDPEWASVFARLTGWVAFSAWSCYKLGQVGGDT